MFQLIRLVIVSCKWGLVNIYKFFIMGLLHFCCFRVNTWMEQDLFSCWLIICQSWYNLLILLQYFPLLKVLLQRLSYHNMFTPSYLPCITYNLFCSTLRHITLASCSQITDVILKQLGASGCKLHSITLTKCKNIKG